MKARTEVRYIGAWVVFVVLHTVAFRYLFLAGTSASMHFPAPGAMHHVWIVSGIAASLLVSYFVFRAVVKYLIRKCTAERRN